MAALEFSTLPRPNSPLVIYSHSGEGKTHLLVGIGKKRNQTFPNDGMVYLPCDAITLEDLQIDPGFSTLFLFDDLQLLPPDLHHSVVDILDQRDRGMLVAMTTEVPLLEMGLSDELLNRIFDGTYVEMHKADLELLRKLVKGRFEEAELTISPTLTNYLVERSNSDTAMLHHICDLVLAAVVDGGETLNRSLVDRVLGVVPSPAPMAQVMAGWDQYGLKVGISYFTINEDPQNTFFYISNIGQGRNDVLVVSWLIPQHIKETYGLSAQNIWLSHVSSGGSVSPNDLDQLGSSIEDFLQNNPGGLVFLDGVSYLISYNSPPKVVRFLDQVRNMVAEHMGVVLVNLTASTRKSLPLRNFETLDISGKVEELSLPPEVADSPYLAQTSYDSYLDATPTVMQPEFAPTPAAPPQGFGFGPPTGYEPGALYCPSCSREVNSEWNSCPWCHTLIPVQSPSDIGESPASTATEIELKGGLCYLVEEESVDLSMDIFKHNVGPGVSGLMVSRTSPDIIIASHPEVGDADFVWLSKETCDRCISPDDLEIVNRRIRDFISLEEAEKRKIICLEGLEYLSTHNSFKVVLKFLQTLVDFASVNRATLMVSASPAAFDSKDLKQLEREFQQVFI
jgi:archaellum biogenesis ATPase FlaH